MASSLIMGFSWGLAGLAMVPFGSVGELIGLPGMMVIVGAFPLLSVISCLRIPRN
jgi:FSR family fosmidomycin resistance protein-like MFS transporter